MFGIPLPQRAVVEGPSYFRGLLLKAPLFCQRELEGLGPGGAAANTTNTAVAAVPPPAASLVVASPPPPPPPPPSQQVAPAAAQPAVPDGMATAAPFSWPAVPSVPDSSTAATSTAPHPSPTATAQPQPVTPDPLLVGAAAQPAAQQDLITPGSRVLVSDSLSKHYSKKGVVVKAKGGKCKVVFDGSSDALHVISRDALFSLEGVLNPLERPTGMAPTASARQAEVSAAVVEQARAVVATVAPAATAAQNGPAGGSGGGGSSVTAGPGAGPYGGASADGSKWVNKKPPAVRHTVRHLFCLHLN